MIRCYPSWLSSVSSGHPLAGFHCRQGLKQTALCGYMVWTVSICKALRSLCDTRADCWDVRMQCHCTWWISCKLRMPWTSRTFSEQYRDTRDTMRWCERGDCRNRSTLLVPVFRIRYHGQRERYSLNCRLRATRSSPLEAWGSARCRAHRIISVWSGTLPPIE